MRVIFLIQTIKNGASNMQLISKPHTYKTSLIHLNYTNKNSVAWVSFTKQLIENQVKGIKNR